MTRSITVSILVLSLAACGETADLTVAQGTGPNPTLPEPTKTLLPTMNVAKAEPWQAGQMPTAAPGYQVTEYASDLDHPRWLYRLPNGDILVAETNAPERPEDNKGIRGWFAKRLSKKAGAATPSAERITLLRDGNGDGKVDARSVFLEGLHSPFGMALVGSDLYVANANALMRFPYQDGATRIDASGAKVTDLPGGPINHHWTKSLLASPDGSRLYVGVGSNSNVAENGIAAEAERAAVWEIDPKTGGHRVFAFGLRNPVGIDWNPASGALWVAVNERDELGSDLVPDYITSVREGGFYGWPYSYYGQHVDTRPEPQRPDLVAKAIKPDYALGPHTASLGLAFALDGSGAFVGQHGSWNRNPRSGYKVIFVPFAGAQPSGPPRDVLTGFLEGEVTHGRPVGVAFDKTGALLVADDVGNRVWRVTGHGLSTPPKGAPATETTKTETPTPTP
jgi:glucose/arabinose dehydrogenase